MRNPRIKFLNDFNFFVLYIRTSLYEADIKNKRETIDVKYRGELINLPRKQVLLSDRIWKTN